MMAEKFMLLYLHLWMIALFSQSQGQDLSHPKVQLNCTFGYVEYNLTFFVQQQTYYKPTQCENKDDVILDESMFTLMTSCIDEYVASMQSDPLYLKTIPPSSPIGFISELSRYRVLCVTPDQEPQNHIQEFNCTWDTNIVRMKFYDNLTNYFEALLTCTSKKSTLLHISVYKDMEICIQEHLDDIQSHDLWLTLYTNTDPTFVINKTADQNVSEPVYVKHRFICANFDPPVITEFYVENWGNQTDKWRHDLLNRSRSLTYPTIKISGAIAFTCLAKGYPEPNVTIVAQYNRLERINRNTVLLRNPICSDGTLYVCSARNMYHKIPSGLIDVAFSTPSRITSFNISLLNESINETNRLEYDMAVKCSTEGCPKPNFLAIVRSGNKTVLSRTNTEAISLYISNVECSDMDSYTCIADLEDGNLDERREELVIHSCPVRLCPIEEMPRIVPADVDQTINFSVCLISVERPFWIYIYETKNMSVNIARQNNSKIYWTAEITVYNINQSDFGTSTLSFTNPFDGFDYDFTLTRASSNDDFVPQQPTDVEMNTTDVAAGVGGGVAAVGILALLLIAVAKRRGCRGMRTLLSRPGPGLEYDNANSGARQDHSARVIDNQDDADHYDRIASVRLDDGYTEFVDVQHNQEYTGVIDVPYNHGYINAIDAPYNHGYIDVIDVPYNDTYTELADISNYDKLLPTRSHYVYAEMINVRSRDGYTDLLDVVSDHVDTCKTDTRFINQSAETTNTRTNDLTVETRDALTNDQITETLDDQTND